MTTDELVTAITEAVCEVEPHLTATAIRGAVESTPRSPPQLQRLARTLRRDATVLTGPAGLDCAANIEPLIRNIQQIGGTAVRVPACALCCTNESETYSKQLRRRICRSCATSRWERGDVECAHCGKVRRPVYRARRGGWLCWGCKPEPDVDHAAEVRAGISDLATGLSNTEIHTVASAFRTTRAFRELNWILQDDPVVFTGQGPHRSVLSVRLAELLIAAGAAGIRTPQCPFCFREARLTGSLDGLRCCRRCWSRRHSRGPCARCGKDRHLTNYDGSGERICSPCFRTGTRPIIANAVGAAALTTSTTARAR